jgi:hypothetical protein
VPGPSLVGRPHWWVAGASLVLLLVVGLLTWLVIRPDDYVASPPGEVPTARPDSAARALDSLERAVTDRDRDAAAALAPPSDPEAAALLSAVVDNAEALHVDDFTVRYVDEAGAVNRDGQWQAAVDMTFRFAGFDEVPVREEVLVDFALDGDRVAIAGFGGGDRRSPIWLSGPVQVRRGQTLVLVAGEDSDASATSYASLADRAIVDVRRVLPRWRGGLVVEVPESAAALERALAADPGDYANIAAVSASVDGTITPASPVHVFVNPEVLGALGRRGSQVVLSHEATHVATDTPVTAGMPPWLIEGFADYVALRDVDLPLTKTAAQIIEQVRRDGPPDALPGDAEFDDRSSHLGAVYESAWIACMLLAELAGEPALVRLYERVQRTGALEPALRDLFGITERELTRQWRERLEDLSERAAGAA